MRCTSEVVNWLFLAGWLCFTAGTIVNLMTSVDPAPAASTPALRPDE